MKAPFLPVASAPSPVLFGEPNRPTDPLFSSHQHSIRGKRRESRYRPNLRSIWVILSAVAFAEMAILADSSALSAATIQTEYHVNP